MTSDPVCFLGDDRAARVAAVQRLLAGRPCHEIRSARDWPFQRDVVPPLAPGSTLWIRDLHLAFPAGQTPGTRLVLTQSTYQLQRWLDRLDATPDVTLVADADRSSLKQASPEAFSGRGPWLRFALIDATPPGPAAPGEGDEPPLPHDLHAAFVQRDPEHRLDTSRNAVDGQPDDPALRLAFASACMELQLLDDAHAALEAAATLAPDWEAVHFELGKLLLRREDTERAAASFAEAARLMPRFGSALLNLGAALGELGRGGEAVDILQRAVRLDARSHTALNNLGTVYREEGRLDEAAQAFRDVVALAPAFVFGYYNLGHTLLLKGDAAGSRRWYEEGFERDPQKNPRQACRLAVSRAADGDADGALRLVNQLGEELPRERAGELFEEAEGTLSALSAISGVDATAIGRVRAAIRAYSS